MDAQNSRPGASVVARVVSVMAAVTGVLPLAAAMTPEPWLRSFAETIGHADDLTEERLTRFRLVGVALAIGHFALAGLVATAATRAGRFLVQFKDEIATASIVRSVGELVRRVIGPGWLHAFTLVVILGLGTGIRVSYLSIPMDYDEAYSFLNYARRPLYQGLADYDSTNNHLLNTLLMHVEYRAFGQREWALRLHVFAAGVVLIAATYVLGRSVVSPEAGLVAAALVAVSDVLINYSVNARGYVWVAWMTVLFLHAVWRIAHAESHSLAVDWLAATVTAVVGLFAAPIMIYSVIGGLGLVAAGLWRRGHSRRALLGVIVAWVLAVGLVTAWLYAPAFAFRGLAAWRHPFVAPQDWGVWLGRFPAAWLLAVRSWSECPAPWLAVAALGGIGLVSMWFLYRRAFWLATTVVAATFLVMAIQRVSPPPRVFSFLTPVFCLVVASGVDAIIRLICYKPDKSSPRASFATPATLACVVVWGLCAWSYNKTRDEPLPGGLRPCFLVEDVAQWRSFDDESGDDQEWRNCVPEAVGLLAAEVHQGGPARVLVGLPADLPFHYYAALIGWTAPIGGTPQPGEQLYLVARGDDPRRALRENLSLRITDPAVLNAKWQPVGQSDLNIWRAYLEPEPPTDEVPR